MPTCHTCGKEMSVFNKVNCLNCRLQSPTWRSEKRKKRLGEVRKPEWKPIQKTPERWKHAKELEEYHNGS